MKSVLTIKLVLACLVSYGVGCSSHKGDFVTFLREEIAAHGGRTNTLLLPSALDARWTILRDAQGAVITTDMRYSDVKTLLARAYGEPQFYSSANSFEILPPALNSAISIPANASFVSSCTGNCVPL